MAQKTITMTSDVITGTIRLEKALTLTSWHVFKMGNGYINHCNKTCIHITNMLYNNCPIHSIQVTALLSDRKFCRYQNHEDLLVSMFHYLFYNKCKEHWSLFKENSKKNTGNVLSHSKKTGEICTFPFCFIPVNQITALYLFSFEHKIIV